MDKNFLHYKLIPDNYLDSSGKIKEEFKYKINIPELKIKDSKFIPNPGDKFETMLFLPPNSNRIAEGGLRTKGFFKLSYKLVDGVWYICDLDGNPVISAPEDLQNKIRVYVSSQSSSISYLPLITVITVVLNGEKTLEKTIESVISQTYPNVEYIIIDGGSTDGTLDIIKKYEDYIDYWVSEPDDSIYDAMNKGIIVSTGNYLYFMGSSDKIFSTSTIFFILSKINFRVIENLLACVIKISHKNQPSYPKLSNNIPIIHHQGALFNLGKLKEIGFYDLNYKIFSDFDLILRYIKRNGVRYIDTVACEFQVGGISTSRKNLLLKLKEYSTIYLKYGGRIIDGQFLLAITRILYYYFKGILKS
jgi:hypothetical protein